MEYLRLVHPRRLVVLLVVLLLSGVAFTGAAHDPLPAVASGACPLTQGCAFFDTLSSTNPANGTRTNGPDPVVWGTSRVTENSNVSQGYKDPWYQATLGTCSGSPVVAPASATCNGVLTEASDVNGSHTFALQAFYPRQPFDWANRTGTVQFQTDLLSQGTHGSWATFGISDAPVPAPSGPNQGVGTEPANGIFVDFSLYCAAGAPCAGTGNIGVERVVVINNYVVKQYNVGFPSTPGFTNRNSVNGRTAQQVEGAVGQLNTVQIQITANATQTTGISIYASNIGQTSLVKLASVDISGDIVSNGVVQNPPLPLTRGLVWIENQSYGPSLLGHPNDHQFQWANVAFDGPVLNRDLGYDVPDALTTIASLPNYIELGYATGPAGKTFTLTGMVDPGTIVGGDALVEFNWFDTSRTVPSVSVNGNAAITTPWPFLDLGYMWRTIKVPVPVAQLNGAANGHTCPCSNTVTITNPAGSVAIANIDVIYPGAGGGAPSLDCPTEAVNWAADGKGGYLATCAD
jgi:hypothetical protein